MRRCGWHGLSLGVTAREDELAHHVIRHSMLRSCLLRSCAFQVIAALEVAAHSVRAGPDCAQSSVDAGQGDGGFERGIEGVIGAGEERLE
jgi:hypothetical protein